MFRFKSQQNHITNEEFDFWVVKGAGGGSKGCPDLKKKVSYRTVVPTYTENFNILAQLERV